MSALQLKVASVKSGLNLSLVGKHTLASRALPVDENSDLEKVRNLSPSLASILRPQAAYRWLLPYLASITPQYIESILRGALAGNHVQAWELFDLMIDSDPEIAACVSEYLEGLISKKVMFEPYHEEDEEPSPEAQEKCKLVNAAIRNMRPHPDADENDLNGVVRDIIFSRFHGQSLLEIDWFDTYGTGQLNIKNIKGIGNVLCPRSTFWVHPVCYAWDMNGRLGLRTVLGDLARETQWAETSKLGKVGSMVEPPAWNWITSQPRPSNLTEFPPNKFIISIFKSKSGTGLSACVLRSIAWWWCASNFCGDWLLNYAQLFGIPFRKATYQPSTPEPVKTEIRQMLQACGSAGYILLPDTADVEFMEGGNAGANSPQAFLFNFADSQKRKVILHQTMTGGAHDSMGKGGGKAFGEVEDDTKSQCINAGAEHVASIINLQLIPYILTLNYGEGGDMEAPVCSLVDDDTGNKADADILQSVSQLIDVPASHVHRLFRIPKPQEGEEIAGQDVGAAGKQMKIQEEQAKQAAMQRDQQHAQAMEMIKRGGKKAGEEVPEGEDKGDEEDKEDEEEEPSDAEETEARAAQLEAGDFEGHPFRGNQWNVAKTGNVDRPYGTRDKEDNVIATFPTREEAHEDVAERHRTIAKEAESHKDYEAVKYHKEAARFHGRKSLQKWQDYGNKANQLSERADTSKPKSEKDYRKASEAHRAAQYAHQEAGEKYAQAGHRGKAREHFQKAADHATEAYQKRLRYRTMRDKRRAGLEGREEQQGRTSEVQAAHNRHEAGSTPAPATILHDTVEPILARLEAIEKVEDSDTRVKLLKKFLKDLPQISAAVAHDDALAKSITPELVRTFVNKLAEEK